MASDDVKMSRLLKLAQKFNCFYLTGKSKSKRFSAPANLRALPVPDHPKLRPCLRQPGFSQFVQGTAADCYRSVSAAPMCVYVCYFVGAKKSKKNCLSVGWKEISNLSNHNVRYLWIRLCLDGWRHHHHHHTQKGAMSATTTQDDCSNHKMLFIIS